MAAGFEGSGATAYTGSPPYPMVAPGGGGEHAAFDEDDAMANPWLKKNPFMSMWLSGAHSIANSARGQFAAEAKRRSTTAVHKATQDIFALWAGAQTGATKPTRKKKR